MAALKRARDLAAYFFSAAAFFSASFLLNALCLIGLAMPSRRRFARPLRCLLQRLFRGTAAMVRALDVLHLDTPEATRLGDRSGAIWVMNHPTILDGSYVLKFVTGGTCIYKHAIASSPFYGCTARLAGYIPNVGGADMIRLAVDGLERGEDVVIFPEGTRSVDLRLDAFKPGFALIAKRARAPIHVLWMSNPDGFLDVGRSLWNPPPLPAEIRISVLETVHPMPGESAARLKDRVAAVYLQKLEAVG